MLCLQVAVTQRTQGALVVGPATFHFNPKVKHDLGVEQQLHILARFGTDTLDTLALVANDDFFLTITLNQNQGMDMQGFALLLELFDLDGDLVRQLGTHLAHDLFTNQFGGQEAAAAIGDLVFREEVLVFRQVIGDHALQRFKVMTMLGRDRDDLGVRQLLLKPAQVRHHSGFIFDTVSLVQRDDQRAGHVLHALKHHLVFVGPLGAVNNEDHHVDVFQRRRSGFVHVAVQGLFAALVHARGIDVDRLHVAFGLDAQHGHNLEALERVIADHLPENEHFFPEDQITDRSSRFLAAELVREKIMRQMGAELPYQITVEIEEFKQQGKTLHIHALILVERDGQKKIIIGDKGERIKRIGTEARKDMELLFDSKIMLNLWVKVKGGWSDDERALRSLGYGDL